ncbi:MAG: glycolate oxidase subunit GlcF [Gammaproteobacteria bacterium]|nr:glycolate oxidase subunit GlcF [Gammaproteobacteria bacterium]
MQTRLADFIRDTSAGREADAILRKCVHCGFCTATCPTYQLLGNELDGPRGRIYLIKEVLEGNEPGARTRLHLDRCLTCRSCETTCPSGVRYGRLLDIGRHVIETRAPRGPVDRAVRRALTWVLPHSRRFAALLGLGRLARPLMPAALRRAVPARRAPPPRPQTLHARRMVLLEGCVQPALAPSINASAARVLDRLGIAVRSAPAAGCCGAVSHHLARGEEGLDFMRRNVDAWWPLVEEGAEAVIATSSACAAMIKEYGELLANDPDYAERAARISALARDVSEVLHDEDLARLPAARGDLRRRVAFHSPCTLQHGQGIRGVVEALLAERGFELTAVADAHSCCGSAGTYSILQRTLSRRLRERKLEALTEGGPSLIATANIGCLHHLAAGGELPVVHWIELLDDAG